MEEKRQLKSGFTTGTCAAAAAMAAAQALAGGGKREYVSLMTPGGREAAFEVLWQPECGEKAGGGQDGFWPGSESPEKQICMVRKDSGDDPDVTNGRLLRRERSEGGGERRRASRNLQRPFAEPFRISDRRNRGWTGDKEGPEMPGWLSGH